MKQFLISLKALILMTLITGVLYPLFITGITQLSFPARANCSMILLKNKTIGSEFIGQKFTGPEYFWGRPSAIDNNPMPSGGSNLSPVAKAFKDIFMARADTIRKYQGNMPINQIPKDLLFASASGVDPEISPEAAYFQVDRVAMYRNLNAGQITKLRQTIDKLVESPDLGVFGDPRVNVLKLNLSLEKLYY